MSSLLTTAVRSLRHAGLDAVREVAWRTYFTLRPETPPDPVLDADWDLLILLDACRADLFAEVVGAGDYSFEAGETRRSPASSSVEWLERVFVAADDDALDSLAYVTGNPYSAKVLDAERFGAVEEVWRDAWDDDAGTIPPEPITDRSIRVGREGDFDRMVVHYMQPHFPSLASGHESEGIALDEFGDRPMSVWEELRFGYRDRADVWAAYRANLELVLDSVTVLLDNVDAGTAVVSADHGNAVGEYHVYGHPSGADMDVLREVPWARTAATDRHTRDPTSHDGDEGVSLDDRLRSLGYT